MHHLRIAVPIALLLASCTAHNPAEPSQLVNAQSLVPFLEHLGATVTVAEQVPTESFPFFSVPAQRLIVNGQNVHVFEYPDGDSAAQDAARIALLGTPIGGTQITWVDPPRFHRRGQLIVLHVGKDGEVSGMLETILGSPFASRR